MSINNVFKVENPFIRLQRTLYARKLLRTAPWKNNICNAYGKTFTDGEALLIHDKIHDVVKSHGRKQCGKACTQSDTFHIHETSHISEKPCGCKQLGKAYTPSSNLHIHE
jgi:hypothetical protein